jgi:hypothetical protein
MSVTRVDKDFDNLTLTLIAEFDAPIERVWQLWADPRHQDGTPMADVSTTTVHVQLTQHDGGTRMEVRGIFGSKEHMEQLDPHGRDRGLPADRRPDGRPARRLTSNIDRRLSPTRTVWSTWPTDRRPEADGPPWSAGGRGRTRGRPR